MKTAGAIGLLLEVREHGRQYNGADMNKMEY
jgi:hypothetical protein